MTRLLERLYSRVRFSIRAKMVVAFVALALGPMLALGSLLSYRTEQLLRERIAQELKVEVATAAETIETYLAGVRRDTLSLARFLERRLEPKMTESQWRTVEEEFVHTMASERAYYQVRFIGSDGMEAIRVNNQAGRLQLVSPAGLQYKGDRYYFSEAMTLSAGDTYLSPLDFNIEHGRIEEPRRLVVRVAAPVAEQGGQLRGLVVVNVFGEEMLDTLKALQPDSDARALLINSEGGFVEMLQRPAGTSFHAGAAEELGTLVGAALPKATAEPWFGTTGSYLVAAAPVHAASRTWQLAKMYPRGALFADLERLHRIFLWLAVPLALLAAGLAILAARSFSRPIGRLSRFAEELAGGDYDRRTSVTSRDEFGQLASSLNAMAGSLAESRQRLLDGNRSLQAEVARQVAALRVSEADAARSRAAMQALEKQLILADRLASLGMLSATVAHEIGNPLAALQTRLQMMQRRAGGEAQSRDLERMLALVERLGRFLRQLTGYLAPQPEEQATRSDLCQVLRELEFILREEADRQNTALTMDLPAGPLWVCSRAQHLHQIFMNLLLNALQAAGEGGAVRVKARCGAGRTRVEVVDSGPGLPDREEEIRRLFEPLATTKEAGTGLGLAIVRKLVEELGGTVTLRNRRRGGAAAEVTLPERTEECRNAS